MNIGIVTISDRASSGEYEDLSGPAIIETLNDYIENQSYILRLQVKMIRKYKR